MTECFQFITCRKKDDVPAIPVRVYALFDFWMIIVENHLGLQRLSVEMNNWCLMLTKKQAKRLIHKSGTVFQTESWGFFMQHGLAHAEFFLYEEIIEDWIILDLPCFMPQFYVWWNLLEIHWFKILWPIHNNQELILFAQCWREDKHWHYCWEQDAADKWEHFDLSLQHWQTGWSMNICSSMIQNKWLS